MALVRLQERCRGFTEVLEDSREFTYSHNERMWLEDTSETLPDGLGENFVMLVLMLSKTWMLSNGY
jgi:hypothetical protein